MKSNLNYKLQREILKELSNKSSTVKELAGKLERRQEDISRQLSDLLRNNLVNYENEYDQYSGRRTHKYSLTTLGRISLLMVEDYYMFSSGLTSFVKNNSEIKNHVQNSIHVLERQDKEIAKNEEPINYCKLQYSFHDQPLLAALKLMNVPVKKIVETKNSNERFSNVLEKKCDLAIVPSFALMEIAKERQDYKDLVIIGVLRNNCVPPKLVKDDFDDEIFFTGGYTRKKMASSVSQNPIEVTDTELLKGIRDDDYKSFVINSTDSLLLQMETNKIPVESFNHDSILITNKDAIIQNKHLKTIYRRHENLLSSLNTSFLTKHVGYYIKNELLPYIKQNDNIFRELNRKINSEIIG